MILIAGSTLLACIEALYLECSLGWVTWTEPNIWPIRESYLRLNLG